MGVVAFIVLDNIGTDWGAEDSWERLSFSAAGAISAQDTDGRTRHVDGVAKENLVVVDGEVS